MAGGVVAPGNAARLVAADGERAPRRDRQIRPLVDGEVVPAPGPFVVGHADPTTRVVVGVNERFRHLARRTAMGDLRQPRPGIVDQARVGAVRQLPQHLLAIGIVAEGRPFAERVFQPGHLAEGVAGFSAVAIERMR